ncbi:MAG: cyclodeaminase/cyclohydrolase family protein [Candidatus Limnocylindrales bacterium]
MTEPDPSATPFRDLTLDAFTSTLASSEPVPGGGSASAVAAALGASLVTMVARLSTGRQKYAEHEPLLAWAIQNGERLRIRFLALADEDAAAYAGFAAAMKLPRESDAQVTARKAALSQAARHAAEVPMACVEACFELVGAAEALAGRSNANASSDLNVVALLGEAAARGAAANVLINLPSVDDLNFQDAMTIRVGTLIDDIARLASDTHETVGSGERREPVQPSESA